MWVVAVQTSMALLLSTGAILGWFSIFDEPYPRYKGFRWFLGFICVVCMWVMIFSTCMVIATGE